MPSPLTNDQILDLLNDETAKQGGGRRGPRVDPTAERTIKNWFKLNHHMCGTSCEHRSETLNLNNGCACWNPNCKDTRDPDNPQSLRIVVLVKDQYICRYCFLTGYLS